MEAPVQGSTSLVGSRHVGADRPVPHRGDTPATGRVTCRGATSNATVNDSLVTTHEACHALATLPTHTYTPHQPGKHRPPSQLAHPTDAPHEDPPHPRPTPRTTPPPATRPRFFFFF